MYSFSVTVLALTSTLVLNMKLEKEDSQQLSYLNYFNKLRNVLLLDLDRANDHYIDRCIETLMNMNITPFVVRQAIPEDIERPHNSMTVINAMKKCIRNKGRDTGYFILLLSPTNLDKLLDDKFKKTLVTLTTSPTIFLFHGVQNEIKVMNNSIKNDLETFLKLVWSNLRMPRAVAAVLTSSGAPILSTYDPDKWVQGTYGRGIRFFTPEQIVDDDTIIFNPKVMHNFPLKIAFFERYPTSFKLPEPQMDIIKRLSAHSWGYAGLDGFVMGDAIRAFNFNPILKDFGPHEPYGYKLWNGTIYGTLGDIINMQSDIAFNSRFLKPYGVDNDYEFLSYVHTDRLCLIVTKAGPIPTWTKVGRVYKGATWTMILVQVMIISVLRWFQLNIQRGKGYKSLVRVIVETYALILVPVGKVARAPVRQRMLLTICMFMNLVLVSVFQGNLHAAFNTQAFFPDLNTVEDVDKSNILVTISQGFRDVFTNSKTKTYQNLNAKLQIASGVNNNVELIAHGARMATLARESDSRLQVQTVYVAPTGQPMLHVVPECPMSYMLAYIVSRNFPFKRHMSTLMKRLIEAGLPAWYYDITNFAIVARNRSHFTAHHLSQQVEMQPLEIQHVTSAFIILFVGVAISLLLLMGEMYMHKKNNMARESNNSKRCVCA